MTTKACADCGATTDLEPLRLLTSPDARWLCADADGCRIRTAERQRRALLAYEATRPRA